MKFSYTAVNKTGKSTSGIGDSSSKQAFTETLIKQGLRPIVIKPVTEKSSLSAKLEAMSNKVKLKDLVIFSRQMSTMVSAGVPLTRALSQNTQKFFPKSTLI